MQNDNKNLEAGSVDNASNKNGNNLKDRHGKDDYCSFNASGFFFGMLLVVAGLAFLGQNLGWFNIDFNFRWEIVWPLLVIMAGMSMLKFRGLFGTALGIVLTIFILGIVVSMVFGLSGGCGVWGGLKFIW